MESDELLKKIFEHQLLLSEEIKKRLGDQLSDTLKKTFEGNEHYLKELLAKDVVSPKDLEQLQHLWETLTNEINAVKAQSTNTLETVNTQEAISKLYPDAL
ncbi:MAG: hypothetical protein V6Z78_02355 [Holosporaceae bacterium]